MVASLSASADYGLSFWRNPVQHGGGAVNIPGMHGAGGNEVLSLPNGDAIVILGRDDYNHSVDEPLRAALILAVLDLPPD